MKISIVTLFPHMFDGFLGESIIKRAINDNYVSFNLVDPREFSHDKHHHVDDTPYGGGAGMVLACQPMFDAVNTIESPRHIILLTPQGKPFTQKKAIELSKLEHVVLICGHYEGFDERIRSLADEEISIGDYVLTGGELPAMVISDSITRLIPGVLATDSPVHDSHSDGLLEYPQYTKPASYNGMDVPGVLINGNHKLIDEWRRKESLRNTYLKRPDLLENYPLTDEQKKWIEEFKTN